MIDFFHKWADKPFEYGTTDCCQFVGACLEKRYGVNPAAMVGYESQAEAEELIEEWGGLESIVTEIIGEPHSTGQDGDIALVDDQQVLGYVYGDRIVVRAKTGLNDLPLARATRFWSWPR